MADCFPKCITGTNLQNFGFYGSKSHRDGKMGRCSGRIRERQMNMKMKPLKFQNVQISSLSHLEFYNQYPLEV